MLGVHWLRAQLVHASVQRYPKIIREALSQVLENRDQRRLQQNPGIVEVDRFRREERHGRNVWALAACSATDPSETAYFKLRASRKDGYRRISTAAPCAFVALAQLLVQRRPKALLEQRQV